MRRLWKGSYITIALGAIAAILVSLLSAPASADTAESAKHTANRYTDIRANKTKCMQDKKDPAKRICNHVHAIRNRVKLSAPTEPDGRVHITRQQYDGSRPPQCVTGGSFAPDRTTACSDLTWELTQTETVDGVSTVIGTLTVNDISWVLYDTKSLVWTLGLNSSVTAATGTLIDGVNATLSTGCAEFPVCETISGQENEAVTLALDNPINRTWDQVDDGNAQTEPNSTDTLDNYLGAVWTGSGSDGPWSYYDPLDGSLNGRCDNVISSPVGCIQEYYTPTLEYDATKNPAVTEVAEHVFDAQRDLPKPYGVYGRGPALSRDMNPADIAKNRSIACPDTPPAGMSCDEFPMASTHQGAAFVGEGFYSTRLVPVTAQNSQGAITKNFYTGNRVIEGDYFWVKATRPDGTSSWDE